MDELTSRIKDLEQISGALEPSEEKRNELLAQVGGYANNFINNLPSAESYSPKKAKSEAFFFDGKSKSLEKVLEVFSEEVASKGIRAASGGHLGYIPGGGIYGSALGDYLAAVTNEYAGIKFASPGAVAMEHELLNWMKRLFGFPESAVGNLTSGGSIANMIALTAARDRHKVKGAKIEKSVLYLSPQLHHCNLKALRIIGLEDVIIRHLELDEDSKIITRDLSEKIMEDKEAGFEPFLVIASAGTTDTGAIDPLREIGEICKEQKLWFHVDAAYGGFFILTESRKALFAGIELADSLAVDPHKGLFLPYGLGSVLVKDREAVLHSHHYSANYMQDAIDGSGESDPADLSPELTKHFRALRLWLPLQLHGIHPFIACLEEKLLLTRYFRNKMKDLGFELGPEPDLTVTYFWWPVPGGDEEGFNRKLLQEIHKDGTVFLSSTSIKGKFVIRLAVLSFRTKLETINKAIEMLIRIKDRISAELYS